MNGSATVPPSRSSGGLSFGQFGGLDRFPGVHALRPSDISALTLEDADPAAGTSLAGGRARPLDRLAADHLCAWLQARRTRWPATANPYLLVNRSTGGGTGPVSRSYIQATARKAGITAQDLRADRLLSEAQASNGDPLQLTHLFGISDGTAIRYCAETGQLSYDAHQALEGAAGSAGRTESTSVSK